MIFKVTQLILVSIITMTSLSAQTNLVGKWNTGEDNTVVQTYVKDGSWYGKILSSDNPKAKIGTNILREFRQDSGVWKGTIYAAKRDKVVKAEIRPSSDKLNITVFAGFFKKKLEWKRE